MTSRRKRRYRAGYTWIPPYPVPGEHMPDPVDLALRDGDHEKAEAARRLAAMSAMDDDEDEEDEES